MTGALTNVDARFRLKDLDPTWKLSGALGLPPDDVLTAALAEAFHLAGQHNQATHGRGGASPGEIAAAERLNAGKTLDMNDPDQARVHGAIVTWSEGGSGLANLQSEMKASVSNPDANTAGAALMRTTLAAPANAPTLHRGMAQVHHDDVPKNGDVFELGATSFSRSSKIAEGFMGHEHSEFGRATSVHMTLKKGSRSLKIDHELGKSAKFANEEEHITAGKFRVTGYSEKQVRIKTNVGGMKQITRYDIEIEQVPDTLESTIKTNHVAVHEGLWD